MAELLRLTALLLPGLEVTVQVLFGATIIALVLAFPAGLGRLSSDRVIRTISGIYVEAFRSVSAIILLYWLFFALPLFGLDLAAIVVAIMGLGLQTGAYAAEIVRGAVQAIPSGQREAARALNLDPWTELRYVVLPQVLVTMLPPFGNLLIELLKATALVSLITITDLTFQGQLLRELTLETTKIFTLVLSLYFLVAMTITTAMRALERRLGVWR